MYCKFIYEIDDYGKIRVIVDSDTEEVLFCAKDVAKAFGYKEPGKIANKRNLDVIKESHITPGGMQTLNFIDSSEIKRLAMPNFNVGRLNYINELFNIEGKSVVRTRKKVEKTILKEYSIMTRMLNDKSCNVDDVFILMSNDKTYHISSKGKVTDISEDDV